MIYKNIGHKGNDKQYNGSLIMLAITSLLLLITAWAIPFMFFWIARAFWYFEYTDYSRKS